MKSYSKVIKFQKLVCPPFINIWTVHEMKSTLVLLYGGGPVGITQNVVKCIVFLQPIREKLSVK